jgi:glycosyltransferase involved in cell wall biosynthesis
VAESVHPGRSGYLVPPGDAGALAGHLRRLLRHPEERSALGQTGRNWVVRRASVEQMVQGYEELIGRVYRSKCRPAATGRPPADRERLAPLVEGSD